LVEDAKVIHDQGTNMVTIEGNSTMKIVSISKYISGNVKKPHVVINYNFVVGITYEEKELF
jgi:hypothetical protein